MRPEGGVRILNVNTETVRLGVSFYFVTILELAGGQKGQRAEWATNHSGPLLCPGGVRLLFPNCPNIHVVNVHLVPR